MLSAGTYSPLDAPHMRNTSAIRLCERTRPLEWLRTILAHRDRLERIVRGIHGDQSLVGFTTDRLLGDRLLPRAHRHLVEHWAPAHMWSDPVC